MTEERRYPDEQVGAIFEAAATPRPPVRRPASPASSADGLTLAQLQEIGREVGLEPERIAEAAAALEHRGTRLPRRSSLGMPTAVGHLVTLPRAPTDREWELLVTELRETFDARGVERSQGNVRQWANGNLHAYVEPTEQGHRLRLRTSKGDAAAINGLGGFGLLMAVVLLVMLTLADRTAEGVALALLMGGTAGAALSLNALRLSRWAREREAQMERVAERAAGLLAAPPGPAEPAREPVEPLRIRALERGPDDVA